MNKWIFFSAFFSALVSIASIIVSARVSLQYSNDHNRINQIEKILQVQKSILRQPNVPDSVSLTKIDSLSRLLEMQEIREDYYLNQLSILSDWFILYVTGIFVIIGLAGFLIFTSNIKTLEERVSEQERMNKEQFDKFEKEFNDIESVNEVMLGNVYVVSGDASMKQKDFTNAIFSKILAIQCYVNGSTKSGYTDGIKLILERQIDQLTSILGNYNFLHFTPQMNEDIDDAFIDILKGNPDKEVGKRIMDIMGKMNELKNKAKEEIKT